MDCKNNQDVLDQTSSTISLEAKITKQRLSHFGHVMKMDSSEMSFGPLLNFGLEAEKNETLIFTVD